MAKRNNFRRALKQLKSVEIEEKLNGLNEAPTNSMGGVYNLNPKGWHNDPPKPAKTFYPDADGNWPDGFPANAGDKSYTRPAGWWDDDGDWIDVELANTKVDSIGTDGKSTETIIDSDGYVLAPLPEGTRDFILGPLIDGFTYLHGYDAYTSIGYIQKDTRDFVLLGKIDGQWSDNFFTTPTLNTNSVPIWDGTDSGFTSYNEKFKLEHAQWFRDQIIRNKFTKNVPNHRYGGVPQQRPWPPAGGWPDWIPEPLRDLLDNMFGGACPGVGNGDSADEEDLAQPSGEGGHGPDEGEPWTPPGPYEKGDQEDAGGPWPDNPDAPSNKPDGRPDSRPDDPYTPPKSKKRKDNEQRARDHGLSKGRAEEMSDEELNKFNKLQDNLQADIEKFSKQEQEARKEMRDIAIGFGVDVALTLFGGALLKGAAKGISLGAKALKNANKARLLSAANKANNLSKARQQKSLNNLIKFKKTLKGAEKAEYTDDLIDLQHFLKNQPNQANVNKLFNKLNNPKNYGGKGKLLNAVDDVGAGTISQKGSKPFMHKTSKVKNIKTPKQVKNSKTGKMEFDVDVRNSKDEVIGKRFKSPDGKWYEVPNPYKTKGSSNPIKNIGDKLKWEVGERQVSSSQVSKWKQTGEPLKGWRPDRLITDPFGPGSTFSGPTSGAALPSKIVGGALAVGGGAALVKGIEKLIKDQGASKAVESISKNKATSNVDKISQLDAAVKNLEKGGNKIDKGNAIKAKENAVKTAIDDLPKSKEPESDLQTILSKGLDIASNTADKVIQQVIKSAGEITGLESSANMANSYQNFLANPTNERIDKTSDFSRNDLNALQNVRNNSEIKTAIELALKGGDKKVKGFDNKTVGDLRWEIAADKVTSELQKIVHNNRGLDNSCLLYTSPSPRDATLSRMPSSA